MQTRQIDTVADYPVYQIDCDINGNCRYVIHFLAIPFRDRHDGETFADYMEAHIQYARKALYGKKYRAKWFGGGIVFTAPEGARKRVKYAINRVQVDLELTTTEVEHDSIKVTPKVPEDGLMDQIISGIFSEDEAKWNHIADAKLKDINIERVSDWDDAGKARGIRINGRIGEWYPSLYTRKERGLRTNI